jgi:hypothetical protein
MFYDVNTRGMLPKTRIFECVVDNGTVLPKFPVISCLCNRIKLGVLSTDPEIRNYSIFWTLRILDPDVSQVTKGTPWWNGYAVELALCFALLSLICTIPRHICFRSGLSMKENVNASFSSV